jgi:hypothetical protein
MPLPSSTRAISGVIPRPPAAFSAFTITRSGANSARRMGTIVRAASRPGLPTMSPMNRIFMVLRRRRYFA